MEIWQFRDDAEAAAIADLEAILRERADDDDRARGDEFAWREANRL